MTATAFLDDINSDNPNIIERNKASPKRRKKLRIQSLESCRKPYKYLFRRTKNCALFLESFAEKVVRKKLLKNTLLSYQNL